MLHQIEVTTKCNYRCFYCAGRAMAQRHMSDATMEGVLARLAPGRHVVSLQGEGEPTLHRKFWDWAERLLRAGYLPYTITNGSVIDPDLAHRLLGNLGFSLDTVDADEAECIGRLNLSRALANLDKLLARMGPERIIIHTVDYGQAMEGLLVHLRQRGLRRHIIQPLQPKADYARHYARHFPDPRQASDPPVTCAGPCGFLAGQRMRFFDVDGKELPCCFIKDASTYPGREALREQMVAGRVPAVCLGCAEAPRAAP